MKRTTRPLAVLAAILMAAALTGCGSNGSSSSDSGPAKVKLGLVQSQDFIHAMPARVAAAQGFFKDEGLDVTVVDFSAGSDLTKAMAGGSVDVGAATGLDAVAATAHGVPLQAFYGTYGQSPMALIVPMDSKITGFADLKGAKVGISKAGSLTDFITRATLDKVGVPLDSVKEIPLGDPGTTMAAMKRGDIDAFVLPTFFGFIEGASGGGKVAQKVSDVLGNNDQFGILMAKKDYISSHKADLEKLTAAYQKAIQWMSDNKDKTVALAVDKLGMPQPIASQTYDAYMANFTADGELNKDGLKMYADALPDLGIATSVPKESDYLSTSITPGG